MKVDFSFPCAIVLSIIGTLMTVPSFAQINKGGMPLSFEQTYLRKSSIPKIQTPTLDMDNIRKEDEEDERNNVPPRFGYPTDVNLNLDNAGLWETLANGDRLWRLTISCKDALSINLLYDAFYLPSGARLFIYNADYSQVLGAFTSRNNKTSRKFATGLIYDNQITLEYYEPVNIKEQGQITISRIVHGYRHLQHEKQQKKFGSSGNCNVNINCPAGNNWQDEKRGVALMVTDRGTRWCSGSLINNTNQDGTLYFLSAHHCLSGWAIANTLDAISNPDASQWSFIWDYESAGCANGSDITNPPTTVGAVLVANNSCSDFALFRLDESPAELNPAVDVYLNGWNRNNTATTSATGIHHPIGDLKKICVENQTLTSTSYHDTTTNTNATHWRVDDWDVGVTEGGSSGSPLFDNNSRIVGQLHGGDAACNGNNDNGKSDWYGKFWSSWNGCGSATDARRRLSNWLDPNNTGVTTLDGESGAALCVGDTYEPNNIHTAAWAYVSSNLDTIKGLCLTPGDKDYFYFDINNIPYYIAIRGYNNISRGNYALRYHISGSTVTFETVNDGNPAADTYLELYGPDGISLLAQDDDGGVSTFSKIVYTTPCMSDTYETNDYFSQVGFPVISSNSITVDNQCLSTNDKDVFLFCPTAGHCFYARVRGYNGNATGKYKITFNYTYGIFPAPNIAVIETYPIQGFTNTDTYLELYWSNDTTTIIAQDDDSGTNRCSKITYNVSGLTISPTANPNNQGTSTASVTQLNGNDNLQNNALKLYPNPTKDAFTVQYASTDHEAVQIVVYNLLGSELYRQSVQAQQGSNTWKVNEPFPTGIYLVRIEGINHSITKKLTID